MKKLFKIFILVLFFCFLVITYLISSPEKITISYLGHSGFLITDSKGNRIFTDPPSPDVVYKSIPPPADIVTISHEHFDHNYTKDLQGNPIILRGLKPDGSSWNNINKKVKGISITTIGTYHDKSQGKNRGLNSIFIFELDNLRIAHLGDLGHILTPSQIKSLGKIDILMIPIGGVYTIDYKEAQSIVKQLKPKIVIPMHYATGACELPLEKPDKFLSGYTSIKKLSDNSVIIDSRKIPSITTIYFFEYRIEY